MKKFNQTLMLASGISALSAALWIGLRNDRTTPSEERAGPSQYAKPPSPRKEGRSYEPREAGMRRANAPSLSASDEVAEILAQEDLSFDELTLKFMELVLDSSRGLNEREEALDHMFNFSSPERPQPLLRVSSEKSLPEQMAAAVIFETYNFPDRLQGEILINLLENRNSNIRQEAVKELESLTGESLGDKPGAWQNAVSQLSNE